MRVAYLINQYPKVSHSFIRREIHALERAGVEVVRMAVRGWDSEIADAEDLVERDRTRYLLRGGLAALVLPILRLLALRPLKFAKAAALALRMSRRAERPLPVHLIYLAQACRMALWLRESAVDHLHAHFGTNSAEVAMLAHALGGPSWSFTVHGPEEFDKAPIIGLDEKLRRCMFAVAISSFGRSQLYRVLDHRHWSKIHVVHCGVDRRYAAEDSCSIPDARRLVCVGRICEQKGQLLLIEAAKRLRDRGVEFELVLAGDGELRAGVEELVARHELQSRVRITGWVDGARVREEILAARALVLPSFAEGLPVVIMEAMALRRPVISTFVAGIPELVVPGLHGWLGAAGDIDALTDAMQSCLDAPADLLMRMGDAARTRVLDRHDVDREAKRLRELFGSVVQASGK